MKKEDLFGKLLDDFEPELEEITLVKEKSSGTERIYYFIIVYKGKYYLQKMLISKVYTPIGKLEVFDNDIFEELEKKDNLIPARELTKPMYKEFIKMINKIKN